MIQTLAIMFASPAPTPRTRMAPAARIICCSSIPTSTCRINYHPPIAFIGDETVDGPIVTMVRQNTDGKFLIYGQFKNVYNTATSSWVPRNRVARLEADGKTLDPGYDVGVGPNGAVTRSAR